MKGGEYSQTIFERQAQFTQPINPMISTTAGLDRANLQILWLADANPVATGAYERVCPLNG